MTEAQLKIWFDDKFKSCYYIKCESEPNVFYMFYDINYIRAKKLAIILNKDVEIPKYIIGIPLFEINYKYGTFWCNIEEIGHFLQIHLRNSLDVRSFIKEYLNENGILNITPDFRKILIQELYEKNIKIYEYFPND